MKFSNRNKVYGMNKYMTEVFLLVSTFYIQELSQESKTLHRSHSEITVFLKIVIIIITKTGPKERKKNHNFEICGAE